LSRKEAVVDFGRSHRPGAQGRQTGPQAQPDHAAAQNPDHCCTSLLHWGICLTAPFFDCLIGAAVAVDQPDGEHRDRLAGARREPGGGVVAASAEPDAGPRGPVRCRLTIRPEANISIHLQLYKHLPSEQADKIWAQASREYASNANGDTNLFIRGARQDWVFRTTEEPILKSGGQVTKWVYHF
jgi:hypothetical protein